MANFGQKSTKHLNTGHPKLIKLAYEVIKEYDHSVICCYRDEIEQNIAFEKGNSTVLFPNSRHNHLPSTAMDVIPYPKGFNASDREFIEMIAHYMRASKKLDILIDWGGFFILRNGKHFFDGAHIQLAREEYT